MVEQPSFLGSEAQNEISAKSPLYKSLHNKKGKFYSWLRILQERQLKKRSIVKLEKFEILTVNNFRKGLYKSGKSISRAAMNTCVLNEPEARQSDESVLKMPELERRPMYKGDHRTHKFRSRNLDLRSNQERTGDQDKTNQNKSSTIRVNKSDVSSSSAPIVVQELAVDNGSSYEVDIEAKTADIRPTNMPSNSEIVDKTSSGKAGLDLVETATTENYGPESSAPPKVESDTDSASVEPTQRSVADRIQICKLKQISKKDRSDSRITSDGSNSPNTKSQKKIAASTGQTMQPSPAQASFKATFSDREPDGGLKIKLTPANSVMSTRSRCSTEANPLRETCKRRYVLPASVDTNPYKKPRRDFRNDHVKTSSAAKQSDDRGAANNDFFEDKKSARSRTPLRSKADGEAVAAGEEQAAGEDTIDKQQTDNGCETFETVIVTQNLFEVNDSLSDLEEDNLEIDMDDQDSPSRASDATDICEPEWTAPKNMALKKSAPRVTPERSNSTSEKSKSHISPLILKRNSPKSDFELRFKTSAPNSSDDESRKSPTPVSLNQPSPSDQSGREQLNGSPEQLRPEQKMPVAVKSDDEFAKNRAANLRPARHKKARNVAAKSEASSAYSSENETVLKKELGPGYNWLEQRIKSETNKVIIKDEDKQDVKLNVMKSLEDSKRDSALGIPPNSGIYMTVKEALQLSQDELLGKTAHYLLNSEPSPANQEIERIIGAQLLTSKFSSGEDKKEENFLVINDGGGESRVSNSLMNPDPESPLSIHLAIRQKYETLKKLSFISEQKDQEIARIEAEKHRVKMEIMKFESNFKDSKKINEVIKLEPAVNSGAATDLFNNGLKLPRIIETDFNFNNNSNNNSNNNINNYHNIKFDYSKEEDRKPDANLSKNTPPAYSSAGCRRFNNFNLKPENKNIDSSKTKAVLDLSSKSGNDDNIPSTLSSDPSMEEEMDQERAAAIDLTKMQPLKTVLDEPETMATESAQIPAVANQTPLNLALSDKELINRYLSKHDSTFNARLKEFCDTLKDAAELSIFLRKILIRLSAPFNERIMRFVEEENIHKIFKYVYESIRKFLHTDSILMEALNRAESECNDGCSAVAAPSPTDVRDRKAKSSLDQLNQVNAVEALAPPPKMKEIDCYILEDFDKRMAEYKTRLNNASENSYKSMAVDTNVSATNKEIVETSFSNGQTLKDVMQQAISSQKEWTKETPNSEIALLPSNLSILNAIAPNKQEKCSYPFEKIKNSLMPGANRESEEPILIGDADKNSHFQNVDFFKPSEPAKHYQIAGNTTKSLHEKLQYQQSLLAQDTRKANISRQNTVEAQALLEQMILKTEKRPTHEEKFQPVANQYYAPNSTNPTIQPAHRQQRNAGDPKLNDVLSRSYTQPPTSQSLDPSYPIVRTFLRYQQIPPTQSLNQVLVSLQSVYSPQTTTLTDQSCLPYATQQATYATAHNPSAIMVENLARQQMQQQIKYRQQQDTMVELNRKHHALANRTKANRMEQMQLHQASIKNTAANESPSSSDNLCAVCGQSAHFVCSACRKISYCSKECQETSWEKHHKLFCKIQS